jgi:hypothetical protein
MKSKITMRKRLILAVLLLAPFFTKAQYFDSTSCFNQPNFGAYIDSSYTLCDTNFNPNFNINIESTANNIWQKGKTTKFGTSNTRDTSCAIFTDSLNPYSINNYSAFNFMLPNNGNQYYYNFYLKFWHKFDTDSLLDGCWLEFSNDSGMTWHKVDSLNFGFPNNHFQNRWNACNLYTNNLSTNSNQPFDTLLNGTKAWSGNSNGWRYTSLWINMAFPIKPGRSGGLNAIRFVFKSDSINNNKQGWIIDDFEKGYAYGPGAVNDISLFNQLPIYPNPSSNGVFNISFPSSFVKGTMQVFNINGQKIKDEILRKEIDLKNQPNGLYYYKAFFDHKVYSGILNKN